MAHSLPQERLQQRTVHQEQIVAEETTQNIANKEIPQERLPERIEEQIVGILVPPTVEEIVESVQNIQERFQQSIEEQIVDAPVPQVVEEQLVAVIVGRRLGKNHSTCPENQRLYQKPGRAAVRRKDPRPFCFRVHWIHIRARQSDSQS